MSIKVVVVDDSALVRKMLTKILDQDPLIEVVGTASDPLMAREKIKRLNPDVITLDVEMPKMDGITFLEKIMQLRPMPVVMVSSLTERGAEVTLNALEIGAVDFVTKPKVDVAAGLTEYGDEIRAKIKAAASMRVGAMTRKAAVKTGVRTMPAAVEERYSADAILSKTRPSPRRAGKGIELIAIGSSTGGTEAVREVLSALPEDMPPIVIAQHIPSAFSGPFAARVNKASAIEVCEAEPGQAILPGHAYIAPGDRHLLVDVVGGRYVCKLVDGPKVNRHIPSVDVLFRSAQQAVGGSAVGVLLTGMGDDGARGLKEMQEAGAQTIAQDESTSVVWGMPGSAVKLGAANEVLPLGKVAPTLISLCGR